MKPPRVLSSPRTHRFLVQTTTLLRLPPSDSHPQTISRSVSLPRPPSSQRVLAAIDSPPHLPSNSFHAPNPLPLPRSTPIHRLPSPQPSAPAPLVQEAQRLEQANWARQGGHRYRGSGYKPTRASRRRLVPPRTASSTTCSSPEWVGMSISCRKDWVALLWRSISMLNRDGREESCAAFRFEVVRSRRSESVGAKSLRGNPREYVPLTKYPHTDPASHQDRLHFFSVFDPPRGTAHSSKLRPSQLSRRTPLAPLPYVSIHPLVWNFAGRAHRPPPASF